MTTNELIREIDRLQHLIERELEKDMRQSVLSEFLFVLSARTAELSARVIATGRALVYGED